MAGRMQNFERDIAKGDVLPFFHVSVRRRRVVNLHPPHPAAPSLMKDHGSISSMDDQLSPGYLFETFIFGSMVKVTMGIDNIDTAQKVLSQSQQYLVHISTRIDDS